MQWGGRFSMHVSMFCPGLTVGTLQTTHDRGASIISRWCKPCRNVALKDGIVC